MHDVCNRTDVDIMILITTGLHRGRASSNSRLDVRSLFCLLNCPSLMSFIEEAPRVLAYTIYVKPCIYGEFIFHIYPLIFWK